MTMETGQSSSTWTFSHILALMDEQSRTGVLEVSKDDRGVQIHLRSGSIVAVEPIGTEARWLLGDYLVQSGTVAPEAVLAARKEASKKHISIEEALVAKDRVSEDVLKRFVALQASALIFPLFREQGLTIRFVEERPTQSPYGTTFPIGYVLREAERQAAAWPALRQRVGRASAVFKRDGAVMAELLGYAEPDPNAEEPLPDISANARVVYFFVNGKKTVEQLACTCGLTLFATYRALAELIEPYLVTLKTTHGEGEREARETSHIPRVVTVFGYAIVAAVLYLGGQWAYANVGRIKAQADAFSPAMSRVVQEAHADLVDQALTLYQLQRGSFPTDLHALVRLGYVSPRDAPVFGALDYRRTRKGFTLSLRRSGSATK